MSKEHFKWLECLAPEECDILYAKQYVIKPFSNHVIIQKQLQVCVVVVVGGGWYVCICMLISVVRRACCHSNFVEI